MRVRTHTNPFHYYLRQSRLDLQNVFPLFNGLLDVEIGFGRGVFLKQYATANPDRSIVGAEIRTQIVDSLKQQVAELELQNVYLFHGNGHICLEDMLDDHSIDRLFVFHPDPWMKKSHHKRRVISPAFLKVMLQKLKPTGRVYISTDVSILWEEMTHTLISSGHFESVSDAPFWASYTSHWSEFSARNNRVDYRGTFALTKASDKR